MRSYTHQSLSNPFLQKKLKNWLRVALGSHLLNPPRSLMHMHLTADIIVPNHGLQLRLLPWTEDTQGHSQHLILGVMVVKLLKEGGMRVHVQVHLGKEVVSLYRYLPLTAFYLRTKLLSRTMSSLERTLSAHLYSPSRITHSVSLFLP